jgi:hypothetical protein
LATRLRRPTQGLGATVLGVALSVAVGACAAPAPGGSGAAAPPGPSLGPTRTAGVAAAQTRGELERVLGGRSLILRDTQAPFRPPEDQRFTVAPRALYQVVLPQAPTEGFIVVYEFADPIAAAEAAADQAAYLGSGPGRVQAPFGTRHILRLVGSTVVLYSWLPEAATDARQPEVQAALETLGTGVPVPS